MIQKFAAVPGFRVVSAVIFFVAILAGTQRVRAQQPAAQQPEAQQPPATQQQPAAQQQPDNQQSSGQEPAPEESTRRKVKPKDYKNWTFNVGGGVSLTNGETRALVRSGGGIGAAGVARNYNKYFGFRLDFQFDNLPLRNTALELAGPAPGATSHMYSLMLEPIINIPVTKDWGGYILFGPAYFHRSGRLDSSVAVPGSPCNPFFTWWGRCYNGHVPQNGNFLSESLNQYGYDIGVGITRKIRPNIELYGEFRQMHGSHNSITTDLRPITIGVRW